MKTIPLSRGKAAIVDDDDYEFLNESRWYVSEFENHCYAVKAGTKRTKIFMHRVIMGALKDVFIDHINGNGLDNKRCNLRICTNSQNQQNRHTACGVSKHKGVHWNKKERRWYSKIKKNGKCYWLGGYKSEIAAAIAYNTAARELFGEFAYFNEISQAGEGAGK